MYFLKDPPSFSFECPSNGCGENIDEFFNDMPSYDISADRISDGENCTTQNIICTECGESYSIEMWAGSGGAFTAHVVNHPNIDIKFDAQVAFFDEEFEYNKYLASLPPTNPYEAYKASMDDLKELISMKPNHDLLANAYYRMCFTQYISVMEAYLSDRLIVLANHLPEVMESFLNKVEKLSSETYRLKDFYDDPKLVEKAVVDYLQSRSFHDVEQVNTIYGKVLGGGLFPKANLDNKEFLIEATKKRHDCVHRNGRDKSGKLRAEIDEEYMGEVHSHIEKLVEYIEDRFKKEIGIVADEERRKDELF